MEKNIFNIYSEATPVEEQVTTESAVAAVDPIESILGEANFQDAVITVEDALAYSAVVAQTNDAIVAFDEAFAAVDADIVAGNVTTESAQKAVAAYDALCGSLNITPEQIQEAGAAVITTEDSTKYPEATVELTKESATKIIDAIKVKVAAIIKKIADTLKTVGVKLVADAINGEQKAAALQKMVNEGLTDELKDGAEIEFEFVASRLAVAGKLDKASVKSVMEYANDSGVAKAIDDAFKKDVAGNKFEEIYKLDSKSKMDVAGLFADKDGSVVASVYAINVNGDSVEALVVRKKGDAFSIGKESAKVTKLDGFKSSKPLTRKDITELAADLVRHSKKQKDLVKAITDHISMPALKDGDEAFLNKVPAVINTLTSAYIGLAMGSATTNRSVLAILANSASLYKKKGGEEKKEGDEK